MNILDNAGELCIITVRQDLRHFFNDDQVDVIIDGLAALGEQVRISKQKLEEVSITTSALRFSLASLQDNLASEVAASVGEVDAANQNLKAQLKAEISQSLEETRACLAKHTMLDTYSELQRIENTKLSGRNTSAELELNKRLSEKATYLQFLNETKKRTQSLRDEAKQLDEATEALFSSETGLTAKKKEFKENEKVVKSEIDSVLVEIQENLRSLQKKRGEVQDLVMEFGCQKEEVEEKRQRLEEFNTMEDELLKEEYTLKTHSANLKITWQSITRQGNVLKAKRQKAEKEYRLLLLESHDQISKIKDELQAEEDKKQMWIEENSVLEKELNVAEGRLKEQTDTVTDARKKLQEIRDLLLFRIEDPIRMSKEIKDMERKLAQITESHRSTLDVFRSQLDNLRDKLTMDKKDRQDSQHTYVSFQKKAQSERSNYSQTLQDLSSKLRDTRTKNETLAQREAECKDACQQFREKFEQCELEWATQIPEYTETKEEYEAQKSQMEKDYSYWMEQMNNSKSQLMLLKPVHADLEQKLSDTKELYGEMTRKALETKSLDAAMQREFNLTKELLQEKKEKKKLLQRALAQHSRHSHGDFRDWSKDIDAVQTAVACSRGKLAAVIQENEKLAEKTRALEGEERHLSKMRAEFEENQEKDFNKPKSLESSVSDLSHTHPSSSSDQSAKGATLLDSFGHLHHQLDLRTKWLKFIFEEHLWR